MLMMPALHKRMRKLDRGERVQYIELPDSSYAELKRDFKTGTHLAEIDRVDLRGAGGVLIRCLSQADGLMAAAYLMRKYEAEFPRPDEEWDTEADEMFVTDDDDDDAEDEDELDDSFFRCDGRTVRLPVISEYELSQVYAPSNPFHRSGSPMQYIWDEEKAGRKPYWVSGDYPLIVEGFGGHAGQAHQDLFGGRFLLYIQVQPRESFGGWAFGPHQTHYEKSFLFETDFEACTIEIPPMAYYEESLAVSAARRAYRIARSVDRGKLIKALIDYRGMAFQSVLDIDRLVGKAILKKNSAAKQLTDADFERVLGAAKKKTASAVRSFVSAEQELDRMIGLDDVKQQLKRVIRRMELFKRRRDNGYKSTDAHLAACFLGSPGTSKTTTARIFGRMLCEANVLVSDAFVEVSRKDLVGQYVGWTAPTVARVFEEAKGGTLFIDEAYSLMSEGKDGYSAEALSEIVRQMENNPDTLVIFAGYSDKMRAFIQQANPGLRSRLTNLIEFKDYDADEMWAIFRHFVETKQYVLGDPERAEAAVRGFLAEIGRLTKSDTGNGRLMRKLFQTSVGFMADRDDHDLRTIETADIEQAVREMLGQEAFLGSEADRPRRIGFA